MVVAPRHHTRLTHNGNHALVALRYKRECTASRLYAVAGCDRMSLDRDPPRLRLTITHNATGLPTLAISVHAQN